MSSQKLRSGSLNLDSPLSNKGTAKSSSPLVTGANPSVSTRCLAGCKKIVDVNSKALNCDFCNSWCHLECDTRISAKIYIELAKTSALLYMCKGCKLIHPNVPLKLEQNSEDKIQNDRSEIHVLENAVHSVQREINTLKEQMLIQSNVSWSKIVKNSTNNQSSTENEICNPPTTKGKLSPTDTAKTNTSNKPKIPFSPENCVVIHNFNKKALAYNHLPIRQRIGILLDKPVIQFINQYDKNDPKLIVQFANRDSASKLLTLWDSAAEGCSARSPIRPAILPEGVVFGVPEYLSEGDLLAAVQSEYPSCSKVIRFVTKERKILKTCKLIFKTESDLHNSIQKGIYIKDLCLQLLVQTARPSKPRPQQCYNCWGYGHSAQRCRHEKVCAVCSEKIDTNNPHNDCGGLSKCSNCGSVEHQAKQRDLCPTYAKLVEKLTSRMQ